MSAPPPPPLPVPGSRPVPGPRPAQEESTVGAWVGLLALYYALAGLLLNLVALETARQIPTAFEAVRSQVELDAVESGGTAEGVRATVEPAGRVVETIRPSLLADGGVGLALAVLLALAAVGVCRRSPLAWRATLGLVGAKLAAAIVLPVYWGIAVVPELERLLEPYEGAPPTHVRSVADLYALVAEFVFGGGLDGALWLHGIVYAVGPLVLLPLLLGPSTRKWCTR